MPRKPRLDAPGVLQHVIARGIERGKIFLDEKDYQFFKDRLGKLILETQMECFAWVLLSNHFHLLLRTGPTPLPTFMRRLMTAYAGYYNLRIGLVENLEKLERYPWCGYGVLMGKQEVLWQKVNEVLEYFGQRVKKARLGCRQFMEKGALQETRDDLAGGASGHEKDTKFGIRGSSPSLRPPSLMNLEVLFRKHRVGVQNVWNPITQQVDPVVCECCGQTIRTVFLGEKGPKIFLLCGSCKG